MADAGRPCTCSEIPQPERDQHDHDDHACAREERRKVATARRPSVREGDRRAQRHGGDDAEHADPVGRIDIDARRLARGHPARRDRDDREREQRADLRKTPPRSGRVRETGTLEEIGGCERDDSEEQESRRDFVAEQESHADRADDDREHGSGGAEQPARHLGRARYRGGVGQRRPTGGEQRATGDGAVEDRRALVVRIRVSDDGAKAEDENEIRGDPKRVGAAHERHVTRGHEHRARHFTENRQAGTDGYPRPPARRAPAHHRRHDEGPDQRQRAEVQEPPGRIAQRRDRDQGRRQNGTRERARLLHPGAWRSVDLGDEFVRWSRRRVAGRVIRHRQH